jgi:hypothetical protein
MKVFAWSAQGKKLLSRSGAVKGRRRNKSFALPRRLLSETLEDRKVLSALVGSPHPNETVDTSFTASQLAQALVGEGVTVSNATFTGGETAKGSFNFTDPTVIGFNTGVVLSSGNVADVVGPNTADWTSTDFTGVGDADLTHLSGYPTYDASVVEFDFVPTANQVVFSYAFASDEYPEWVNTPFNDVFAFYVNGTNYATVRQTAGDPNAPFVPVAVNNINNGNPDIYPEFVPQRPDLFRANYVNATGGPSAIDMELDGITHVLTFQAPVNANVVNHMKLAIADASDGIYDSAVFIQAGSLVSNANPVADLSLLPERGAAPLLVTAFIEGEDPNGLPLEYTINWGDGSPDWTGSLDSPVDDDEKTAQVDHVYTSPGEFIVTLTVSNGTASDVSIEDVDVLSAEIGAPVVTSKPQDRFAVIDGPFTFSAAAIGLPAPSVQWQVSTDSGVSFVNIPGANATSYTSTATLENDGYQYRAVFTNSEGSATTTAATLHVTADEFAPMVTSDPIDQDVSVGDLFSFTAAATGMPSPTVQWEVSTDSGETWTDIANATSTTYSAFAAETDDGNEYRAVFTNSQGDAITQSAKLSVSTNDVDLAVTSNPADQAVVEGDVFTFSAAAVGAQAVQWQVSLDGGASFNDIPGATSTTLSGAASLADNGNQYRAVFYASAEDLDPKDSVVTDPAVLTVQPVAPEVALANDTGSASNDKLTNVGTLVVSGLAPGASVEYSVDSGLTWGDSFTAAEGLNTVLVRQTVDDNSSAATMFEFILDTTLPKPPRVDLAQDTGSSPSDHITRVGAIVVTNVEPNAHVEYSFDGGATWADNFDPVEGANSVKARQTDLAGNISDAALLSYLLDTAPPAAPSLALANDTGASSTDLLTNDGTLAVSGLEADAAVEYSLDGAAWSNVFAAVEGLNTVFARQIDLAGNASDAMAMAFTLDSMKPTSPSVALMQDTGSSNGDQITNVGELDLTGIEAEATVEFSADNGATWTASFTAVEGANSVSVRQTDAAGNVSDATTFSFTLDTTAPTLNPAFSTGSNLVLLNQENVTVAPNASDAVGVASESAGAVDTSTVGTKTVPCAATDVAGNTVSVAVPYTVVAGYTFLNVTPQDGGNYRPNGKVAVSFQLADLQGVLSDQAAAILVSQIAVTLDGAPTGHVKYNKKTDTFTVEVRLHKASEGPHEIGIAVNLMGTSIATESISIYVIAGKQALLAKLRKSLDGHH